MNNKRKKKEKKRKEGMEEENRRTKTGCFKTALFSTTNCTVTPAVCISQKEFKKKDISLHIKK
jgi:hypothetical protein